MRTKLMGIALTAVLASSAFAGVASAGHDNNDGQKNSHGMCTAYFSGSETGQENKRKNGNSFQEFVASVGDYNDDGDINEWDVAAWCNDYAGGYGNPGGGNTPFFPTEEPDPSDTCGPEHDQTCDYSGGDGTGNGGDGNGNGKDKG